MASITHTGGAHSPAVSPLSVSESKEGAVGTGVANKVGGRVWPNREVIRANRSEVKQNREVDRLGKGRGSESVRESGKLKIFQTRVVRQ